MPQSVTKGENINMVKPKRGQKLCKNCNQINGARAGTCKHCNTEFFPAKTKTKFKKKRSKKYIKINWEELQRGDYIKVFKSGGNYYINDVGEKVYMSKPGIYTVHGKDDNGLIVYSNKNGGFGYIYMGKETQSNIVENLYRSKHKIAKVNIPQRQDV